MLQTLRRAELTGQVARLLYSVLVLAASVGDTDNCDARARPAFISVFYVIVSDKKTLKNSYINVYISIVSAFI